MMIPPNQGVQLYLSRRNLLTLLEKLDHVRDGGFSECTIIKHDDDHPRFAQSVPTIIITAVEDEDYYTDRDPGPVAFLGEPLRRLL